ncbi:MAG: DUF1573 domain-containing protein [Spirosomaceae bacterium]|jgi:hypothetical protein|nr:DUF1573 domain-containing protein [Spirosomataceae bacterium]
MKGFWVSTFVANILMGLVAVLTMGCGSNQDQSATGSLDDKLPKIVFKEDIKNVDFGTLKEGDQVERLFHFTNKGDFPLIINNVTASCGCTIPEWPRDPIGPSEEGTIKVRFNSRGKQGPQFKSVMIYANTNPAVNEIQFKADVIAKADSTINGK